MVATYNIDSSVSKILCVAEKPSVALAITAALKNGNATTETFQGTQNSGTSYDRHPVRYQVLTYTDRRSQKEYTMYSASVAGHVTNMDFKESRFKDSWNATHPSEILDAELAVTVKPEMALRDRCISFLARSCELLVLWLDCDREGEYIAYEVIDAAKRGNRSIKVARAQFSAIDAPTLQGAMRTLVPPDSMLAASAGVRNELDFRLGILITRYITTQFFRLLRRKLQTGDLDVDSLTAVIQPQRGGVLVYARPTARSSVTNQANNVRGNTARRGTGRGQSNRPRGRGSFANEAIEKTRSTSNKLVRSVKYKLYSHKRTNELNTPIFTPFTNVIKKSSCMFSFLILIFFFLFLIILKSQKNT